MFNLCLRWSNQVIRSYQLGGIFLVVQWASTVKLFQTAAMRLIFPAIPALPWSNPQFFLFFFGSIVPSTILSGRSQSAALKNPTDKVRWASRFVPGAAGWEARMLPLCYAAPPSKPQLFFLLPIPCTYTSLTLDVIARNFFIYMETKEHTICHVWIHFIPASLYPRREEKHLFRARIEPPLASHSQATALTTRLSLSY